MSTVVIKFKLDNADVDDGGLDALRLILAKVPGKIMNIMARDPAVLCKHPESDDVILDGNGNTIGSIKIT